MRGPRGCDSHHAVQAQQAARSRSAGAAFREEERTGAAGRAATEPQHQTLEAKKKKNKKRRSSSQLFALPRILPSLSHPSKTRGACSSSSALESEAAGERPRPREIQRPALPRAKRPAEARHAGSRSKGMT